MTPKQKEIIMQSSDTLAKELAKCTDIEFKQWISYFLECVETEYDHSQFSDTNLGQAALEETHEILTARLEVGRW